MKIKKIKENKISSFETDHFNEKGQAVLIAAIFFMFVALSLILALAAPALSHLKSSYFLYSSFEALAAAESGMEDTFYRFKNVLDVDENENLDIGRNTVSVTYNESDGVYIESKGIARDGITRKVALNLVLGAGLSFSYAAQVGDGGLVLEDTASVEGDVFSTGPVTGSGNNITGSVIVAGGGGLIDNVNIGGSAYAYSIENSTVGEDVYYMNLVNTTYFGDEHPNFEPLDPVDLPITEEVMNGWKEFAEIGGVIDCEDEYVINSDQILGPVHITCDLNISGNPTVTLGGHVWVEGNIVVGNSPLIKADDSLGDESVVLLADDPTDRINGSTIELGNNPVFEGATVSEKSFIFLVSTNEAAAEGGSVFAITDGQRADGDVFIYAERGELLVRNNIDITGLTAYKITARDNANIVYQEGLADAFFSAGPSAGFVISGWKEIE